MRVCLYSLYMISPRKEKARRNERKNTMKHLITPIFALGLSACAVTSQSLMQQEPDFVTPTTKTVAQASYCISKNALAAGYEVDDLAAPDGSETRVTVSLITYGLYFLSQQETVMAIYTVKRGSIQANTFGSFKLYKDFVKGCV